MKINENSQKIHKCEHGVKDWKISDEYFRDCDFFENEFKEEYNTKNE